MATTYSVTSAAATHTLTVGTTTHSVSLSRTGGQGSQGDSISAASINSSGELLLTITNSLGVTTSTVNAGAIVPTLNNISDVTLTAIADGQVLKYDSGTSKFVNHTLTTTNISDVDNSSVTDGAMLLYDGGTSTYKATVSLNNANTYIIGGTY